MDKSESVAQPSALSGGSLGWFAFVDAGSNPDQEATRLAKRLLD